MKKSNESLIKEEEAVRSMIYVLAKLGYPRSEVEMVTDELKRLFDLSCSPDSFEGSLAKGKVERRNLLPTIDQSRGT